MWAWLLQVVRSLIDRYYFLWYFEAGGGPQGYLSDVRGITGLKPQPVRYYQPGPFGGNEPVNGDVFCEGPHYPAPHSWYAACTAKDGVIVKVK
jgi:hypothetical protein